MNKNLLEQAKEEHYKRKYNNSYRILCELIDLLPAYGMEHNMRLDEESNILYIYNNEIGRLDDIFNIKQSNRTPFMRELEFIKCDSEYYVVYETKKVKFEIVKDKGLECTATDWIPNPDFNKTISRYKELQEDWEEDKTFEQVFDEDATPVLDGDMPF